MFNRFDYNILFFCTPFKFSKNNLKSTTVKLPVKQILKEKAL